MNLFNPNTEGLFDLSADEYFAAPGLSHSMLKAMDPTPAHYQAWREEPEEPTPEMILGTLIHNRILSPEEPLPRLAIKPKDMKFSTREGKAWRAEQRAAGLVIIPEVDHDALWGTTKSVSTHPLARELLTAGFTEVSAFARWHWIGRMDPNSLTCLRKGRFDFVPLREALDPPALVDVKTTTDASEEAFGRELINRGYATQAAWYLDLWNSLMPDDRREQFVFIVVEKKPPYLVAHYSVHPNALRWARERNADKAVRFMQCEAENSWPGYPEQIITLDLPPYAYRQLAVAA